MDEKYGDGSDCIACEGCGMCITCGDCKKYGCGKEIHAGKEGHDGQCDTAGYNTRLAKAITAVLTELDNMTDEEFNKELDKYKDDPKIMALLYAWDHTTKI